MYEAKSEFPEGWGDHRANPFCGGGGGGGGYGYFLEPHIVVINNEMNVLLYCLDIVHCSVVNGMRYSISKNDFMLEHQQTVNGNIIC